MELDIIKLQTTWNDAAGSINSNYAKIADAIAQLKANGGGSGGADIDLTAYATKVWVEANYAPLTSVQGFENRIGGLEGAVPQLNERVDSNDEQIAILNETTSGHTTSIGTLTQRVDSVEQLATTKLDSSYFTLANIKSTLGISDWALASAAPTIKKERLTNFDSATPWTAFYTSFRASNRPAGANYFSGFTLSNIDFQGEDNTYLIQLALSHTGTLHTRYRMKGSFGAWRTLAFTSDIPTKLSQLTDDVVAGKYLPLSGGTIRNDSNAVPLTIASSAQAYTAMSFINKNNERGYLIYEGGSDYGVTAAGWSATYTLMHSGNIGNYKLSQLTNNNQTFTGRTDGIISNTDADNFTDSGAYLFQTGNGENNTNFPITGYGILNVFNSPYSNQTTNYVGQLLLGTRSIFYRTKVDTWSDWKEIITEKNIGSYNAGSATKLQTPRTLWGNDFDGTAPVSGDLISDIWRIIKDYTWNGLFIQSANYNGTSDLGNIYMSAIGGNKLTSFNVWANNSKFSNNVTVAGNVGIGNESPTEKLDVTGNIKASGNINATSITINGVTITASNGSITVNGNVFATGDITGGV